MPNYDRQLIIQFLTGGAGDRLIKDNAVAIDRRAKQQGLKSAIVTMPYGKHNLKYVGTSIKTVWNLNKVTADTRLYLQGHGDWQAQKLGDWDADDVAGLLGGAVEEVKTVSILGCSLGRDLGAAGDARVGNAADSFASKLHSKLRRDYGIITVVKARIYNVVPVGSAFKQVFNLTDGQYKQAMGAKGVNVAADDDNDMVLAFGRAHSKLEYYWEGNTQRRRWAY